MDYYVYVGVLNSEVMYVGKGSKDRMKHLNSGTSNCYQANKLHFSGGELDVYAYAYFYSNGDAMSFEKELVLEFSPVWNIMLNPRSDKSMFKPKKKPIGNKTKGKKPHTYTSNYLGVGFYKQGTGGKKNPKKHWRASYNNNGVKHHIGFYETELEAAFARDKFIIENRIDLPLNFP